MEVGSALSNLGEISRISPKGCAGPGGIDGPRAGQKKRRERKKNFYP